MDFELCCRGLAGASFPLFFPCLSAFPPPPPSPEQHSVKELRSVGLTPDFLICRSTTLLDPDTKYVSRSLRV